jgi:excisionase family DNA binding protein
VSARTSDVRLVDTAALPGRLALSPREAAAALGVGLTYFQQVVQPDLKIVRIGRRRLIPVSELVRWLEQHAKHALGPGDAAVS